jgi:hypothetical protein
VPKIFHVGEVDLVFADLSLLYQCLLYIKPHLVVLVIGVIFLESELRHHALSYLVEVFLSEDGVKVFNPKRGLVPVAIVIESLLPRPLVTLLLPSWTGIFSGSLVLLVCVEKELQHLKQILKDLLIVEEVHDVTFKV